MFIYRDIPMLVVNVTHCIGKSTRWWAMWSINLTKKSKYFYNFLFHHLQEYKFSDVYSPFLNA